VFVLAISWWGVTYVPILQDDVPNLFILATPTIRVDADKLASDATVADVVGGRCHHIPFLLRPIASRPAAVKVVVISQGRWLGYAVFSCHGYDVTDSNITGVKIH
jgi:hypothetical protein